MLLHMAGLGTQGSKAGLAMYQAGDPMKLHGRGFVGLLLLSHSLSSFFFVHDPLQFSVLFFLVDAEDASRYEDENGPNSDDG